jgi:hypothetical protein
MQVEMHAECHGAGGNVRRMWRYKHEEGCRWRCTQNATVQVEMYAECGDIRMRKGASGGTQNATVQVDMCADVEI